MNTNPFLLILIGALLLTGRIGAQGDAIPSILDLLLQVDPFDLELTPNPSRIMDRIQHAHRNSGIASDLPPGRVSQMPDLPSNPGEPHDKCRDSDSVPGSPSRTVYAPGDYRAWFFDSDRRPVEVNNDITVLVGIDCIKREMARALQTVTGSNHYVYLCNWEAEGGIRMPSAGNTDLMGLLTAAASNGAKIRALLFGPVSTTFRRGDPALLDPNVSLANKYKNYQTNLEFSRQIKDLGIGIGDAFLDDKRLMWGSHHQKILIVRGNEGLIAFCGSYDFDELREGGNKDYSGPWHEVTTRVTGPAAYRLLQVFLERWTDSAVPDEEKHGISDFSRQIGKSGPGELPKRRGGIPAQVTITAGNLKDNKPAHAELRPYDFARSGEMSCRKALLKAIDAVLHQSANATEGIGREIYLECQYGWGETGAIGETLRAKLTEALRMGVHVTVVTPRQNKPPDFGLEDAMMMGRGFNAGARKGGLLGALLGGGAVVGYHAAIRLDDFQRAQDWFWWKPSIEANGNLEIYHTDPEAHYIHSKLWIFNRSFALIGSANFNNRSLTHDSEVMIGFYDPARLGVLRDRLFRTHVPETAKAGSSTSDSDQAPPQSAQNTRKYEIPKILYDNFKGVGNAMSDLTFSRTIDPYGGPRNLDQLDDSRAGWVDRLEHDIEHSIAADLESHQ
jgi:phosphatidylserine/phosphatidylglycerophosphate/cardiolipin synthase-like enzyme